MPAATYDPITLQSILQSIPEVQRRRMQAERLRGLQGRFRDIGQQPGNPNYTPTTRGGLGYETISRYTPDYVGATNQIIGALGEYMTGRKADTAQGEYESMRNQEILRAADQLNRQPVEGDGSASNSAIRAYLGILGGPEIKDIVGNQVRVSSTKVDENGKVWNIMSNGQVVPAGITADYSSQLLQIPGQDAVLVGKSGAGRGQAQSVQFGGQPPAQAQQPGANGPEVGGNIDRNELHERMKQAESAGNPDAVSPKGARGLMQLMPNTARELEAAMGMPAGTTNVSPEANEKAGRAYMDQLLQKYGGDQSLALAAYNWGMGNVDAWLQAGADPSKVPKETQDYVKKILTAGQTPVAQAGKPAQAPSLRTPTKYEEALDAARAKNVAEAEGASTTAQVAGMKKASEMDAETAAKARAALPGIEASTSQALDVIGKLRGHKGLSQITGGLGGRVPDSKIAQGMFNAIMAGTPAADAMALHQQLRGEVFLKAYETLKGGGQITEVEGQKAEAAMARLERAQSTKAYVQALGELEGIISTGLNRARTQASGGQPSTMAPAAAAQPAAPAGLPSGWKVRVKGG